MWQLLVIFFHVAQLVLMLRTSQPCKYVMNFHMRNVGYILLIFCCLGLRSSLDGVCDSTSAHHRKLSHPFSQLARPKWPRGAAARQSACQIQTWPWLFLHGTIQFCGVEMGNMWPIFFCVFVCVCVGFVFTPHLHPSLTPFSPSSYAWYLGHVGTAFFRRNGRELTVHLLPRPRYIIENIQMD